jgi:hypothetical protein
MKNKTIAALSLAVGLAFGSGAAMAQATAGAIVGNGKPGETVVISNEKTGFSKEVTVKENGKFRLANLFPGEYVVVVKHEDGSAGLGKRLRVNAGSSSRYVE